MALNCYANSRTTSAIPRLRIYAGRTGILLIPAQRLAVASPFTWTWLNTRLEMRGMLWFSLISGVIIAFLTMALAKQTRTFRPDSG